MLAAMLADYITRVEFGDIVDVHGALARRAIRKSQKVPGEICCPVRDRWQCGESSKPYIFMAKKDSYRA